MKGKILSQIFLLLVSQIVWSLDFLEGYFDGVIDSHYKNGMFYGSTSSYYLDNNEYELWYSMDSADDEVRNIPHQYLAEDRGLGYLETGKYLIRSQKQFSFIELRSSVDFTLKTKLGVLFHPRRMYLYEGDQLFFMSTERFGHDSELGPYVESINSSSFLIEGITEYQGRNIIRPFLEKSRPWVEGVSGNGVGEWIELETSAIKYPVSSFLISNGYVSFEKLYLYEYNNRVKRLRLTCDQLGIDFEIELEDTPNFQEIRLPVEIMEKNATFRFEILEVYEGLKWNDTCINLIIPLGDMSNSN